MLPCLARERERCSARKRETYHFVEAVELASGDFTLGERGGVGFADCGEVGDPPNDEPVEASVFGE